MKRTIKIKAVDSENTIEIVAKCNFKSASAMDDPKNRVENLRDELFELLVGRYHVSEIKLIK